MIEAEIIIAGGGASGLTAALYAARYSANKNVRIYIIEHMDMVGKKLLATGNGRCNFANDVIDNESFRGSDPKFAYSVIRHFDRNKLLSEMNDIGVTNTSINGYYYPRSLQASQVLDALITALSEYNVKFVYRTNVHNIKHSGDKYILETDADSYIAKYIVVSTGGKAYKSLGSDGSGYNIVRGLGHTVTTLVPSLIGLKASGLDFKICHGVRAKGFITIFSARKQLATSFGEIQFTDYGVSGIPVFQISRYAGESLNNGNKVEAVIDLINEYSYQDLYDMFTKIINKNINKTIIETVNAFIPLKLGKAILRKLGIKENIAAIKLDASTIKTLCGCMKNLDLIILGDCGFDKAQVTAGGTLTDEIDEDTMESKVASNIYITGELLDVDGNCGGYNLHFAFATGAIAGINIGKKVNDK